MSAHASAMAEIDKTFALRNSEQSAEQKQKQSRMLQETPQLGIKACSDDHAGFGFLQRAAILLTSSLVRGTKSILTPDW